MYRRGVQESHKRRETVRLDSGTRPLIARLGTYKHTHTHLSHTNPQQTDKIRQPAGEPSAQERSARTRRWSRSVTRSRNRQKGNRKGGPLRGPSPARRAPPLPRSSAAHARRPLFAHAHTDSHVGICSEILCSVPRRPPPPRHERHFVPDAPFRFGRTRATHMKPLGDFFFTTDGKDVAPDMVNGGVATTPDRRGIRACP